MKDKIFTDYLQNIHAGIYMGTDDNMPESFDSWLSDLPADDFIQYGNMMARVLLDAPYGLSGKEEQLARNSL